MLPGTLEQSLALEFLDGHEYGDDAWRFGY